MIVPVISGVIIGLALRYTLPFMGGKSRQEKILDIAQRTGFQEKIKQALADQQIDSTDVKLLNRIVCENLSFLLCPMTSKKSDYLHDSFCSRIRDIHITASSVLHPSDCNIFKISLLERRGLFESRKPDKPFKSIIDQEFQTTLSLPFTTSSSFSFSVPLKSSPDPYDSDAIPAESISCVFNHNHRKLKDFLYAALPLEVRDSYIVETISNSIENHLGMLTASLGSRDTSLSVTCSVTKTGVKISYKKYSWEAWPTVLEFPYEKALKNCDKLLDKLVRKS